MITLDGAERELDENLRHTLSGETMVIYDEAKTYSDGKLVMFPLDKSLISDYMQLLAIKRKANKKQMIVN